MGTGRATCRTRESAVPRSDRTISSLVGHRSRMRKLAAIDLVLAEIYAARFEFDDSVNSNDGQIDEQ